MRIFSGFLLCVMTVLALASASHAAFITDGEFADDHALTLTIADPMDEGWSAEDRVTVYERTSPDIPLTVKGVEFSPDRRRMTVTCEEAVNPGEAYVVEVREASAGGHTVDFADFMVRKGMLAILVTIILSASLIHNFVFTRYLGLCIFFGTSGRKETAVGMGISFTIVMTLSAFFIWAIYNYVLKPLHLDFLQVLVFVGIVAIFVQFLDTMLRKVNPFLFKKLGVYLVLITTNCIVLAVPLILVDNAYNAWESVALAMGSGMGFALALFLMAAVRERLELADIPEPFRGLPIAFIVAGLFALAFLGFSGLNLG